MTTAADDSAVEDAFEALLAGRPAPDGAAGLAAFTEAVRTSATRPGRPNAALADLLATGLLTDQSSPSVRTARSAGSPPARRSSRVRIRRRTAMIFPVLFAKFLSAGAVAQAATGAGIVVVAFTGAGAAGALPAPVQDTFATVVATVTPLEVPTSEEAPEEVVDETVPEEPILEESVAEEEPETPAAAFDAAAWELAGPAAYPSFGEWVADGARNGVARADGVRFGELVSQQARMKGLAARDLEAELEDVAPELEDEGIDVQTLTAAATAAEVDAPAEEAEPQVATTQRGSRGTGNGAAATDRGERGGDGNGRGNGRN
jgi:hypothetical protein